MDNNEIVRIWMEQNRDAFMKVCSEAYDGDVFMTIFHCLNTGLEEEYKTLEMLENMCGDEDGSEE